MNEAVADTRIARLGIMCAASGGLMVAVGLLTSLHDDAVSSTQWSYPQGTGLFLACALLLTISHALSAAGYQGIRLAGAAPGRWGRWGLVAAIVGSLGLSLSELLSGLIRSQTVDSASAGAVSTLFGVTSLLFAAGAVVAGVSLLRGGQRSLGWLVLLTGAAIVVLVTPANISGSLAFRQVALIAWSVLLIPLGLQVARLGSSRSDAESLSAMSGRAGEGAQ